MGKTPISDEELKRLYETHATAKIGEIFGWSPEAIRKRLVKLGVRMRPRGSVRTFTPSREELEAEYQTHSMRQIADKYGVGETVVWKRLKEFGIKLHDYENGGHRVRPGRIFSEEHRRKIGLSMRGRVGPLNRNWKGGKTAENIRLRGSIEYREWKSGALALHGFKCQECGVVDRTTCDCCGTQIVLHVHHVKSFAQFPESRFDPQNSEVLCPKCHRLRHRSPQGITGRATAIARSSARASRSAAFLTSSTVDTPKLKANVTALCMFANQPRQGERETPPNQRL